MAEEVKQKSKMDTIHLREHQHVLTVGTKVFADPLASYNHKDDLLDIIGALGLDHTGTITSASEPTLPATLTLPCSPTSLA